MTDETAPLLADEKVDQQAADKEQIDEAVFELRLAFAYDRRFWEAVTHGVELGAEEVQDQRLLKAETPPAPGGGDVALLLVMFVLEAPPATRALVKVRSEIVGALQKRLRLQAASYRAAIANATTAERAALEKAQNAAVRAQAKLSRRARSRATGGGKRQPQLIKAQRQAEKATAELDKARREFTQAQQATSKPTGLPATIAALKGIQAVNEGPEYLVAAAKTMAPEAGRYGVPLGDRSAAATSPGVDLRESILTQFITMANESDYRQEEYELNLRRSPTVRAVQEMYEAIGGGDAINFGEVIAYYRLYTAAVIWSQLLNTAGIVESRKKEYVSIELGSPMSGMRTGEAVEAQLFSGHGHDDYLVSRFGDAAEAWARAHPSQVYPPTPGQPVSEYIEGGRSERDGLLGFVQSFTDFEPKKQRLDLVMQWLASLSAKAPAQLIEVPPRRNLPAASPTKSTGSPNVPVTAPK